MSEQLKIPEVIYLQWYGDGNDLPPKEITEDITWAEDKINSNDIKYTRAEQLQPKRELDLRKVQEVVQRHTSNNGYDLAKDICDTFGTNNLIPIDEDTLKMYIYKYGNGKTHEDDCRLAKSICTGTQDELIKMMS